MTHYGPENTVLHADQEHGGVRIIVLVVLILGLFLGFIFIQTALSLLASDTILIEFATVLSCSGAIVLALAITWVTEIYLKRSWPSGTMLMLGNGYLEFEPGKHRGENEKDEDQEIAFDMAKTLNITRWYFELSGYARAGRERRVSRKWLCLACQLQQDDTSLIAFSYYPPEAAAEWIENKRLAEPFHAISLAYLYNEAGKKKRDASTRPAIPSSMLTGSDGRYWLAEQKRWKNGIEFTHEDFDTFLSYLEKL